MSAAEKIPQGYLKNSQGHLVPVENVQEIDKLRDDLVITLVQKCQELQTMMRDFKHGAMTDMETFVDIAAEKYGARIGGNKGNISLFSFDGNYKVQISVQDRLIFDERIKAAKALIDECIHEWTVGSRSEIKALVEHAFQTDKEGRINNGRVFSLMRLKMSDARWDRAMEALKDSITVASSKSYIRFYQRPKDSEDYVAMPLDIAAL